MHIQKHNQIRIEIQTGIHLAIEQVATALLLGHYHNN